MKLTHENEVQSHLPSPEEQDYEQSTLQANDATIPLSEQTVLGSQQTFNQRYSSTQSFPLPSFIRLPAQEELAIDIEYLDEKGALTIPVPWLRNKLLQNFIEFVYPYLPLLDLKGFLMAIERDDGTQPVSLFVFQAVMFAGSAFIDIDSLLPQGYANRQMARRAFFQRARLLFDSDYERDKISLIQGLLLMTYWYDTLDNQKDPPHWLGISLSIANTIGLNRNPQRTGRVITKEQIERERLWKRIWWCCFMRDRLLALSLRRPMRIANEDYDLAMLTLEDFEIDSFSASALRTLNGCTIIRDPVKRRNLANMCIQKAKLCVCIGHILAAQYTACIREFGGGTEMNMMLIPRALKPGEYKVLECDQELTDWCDCLPDDIHYRPPSSKELPRATPRDVTTVHSALLRMIYLTTSSVLHRPSILPHSPSAPVPVELKELARAKVRAASSEVADIAQDLQNLELVQFLPTTAVTALLPVAIIHLLDANSNDTEVRNTSLSKLRKCIQALQRLRDIYAPAGFAMAFLEAALRKGNIRGAGIHGEISDAGGPVANQAAP